MNTLTKEGLLPTHWINNAGHRFTCRLPLGIVLPFCGEHDLSTTGGDLRIFQPNALNDALLFDLAYLGSRWNTVAKAHEQTHEEFLADHEEGTAYEDAIFAARAAVLNFILRRRRKPSEWRAVAAILRERENALRSLLRTMGTDTGHGETSDDSVTSPDTPVPTTPALPASPSATSRKRTKTATRNGIVARK